MNEVFPFGELKRHEFYHLRYGKGAIIVAVPIEDVEERKMAWEFERRDLQGHNSSVHRMIKQKEENTSSMTSQNSKYFSFKQIAQFYSHNISERSDIHTRFDKVSSIYEMGNFIDITLHFNDQTSASHHYQKQQGINTLPGCPFQTGQFYIEGNIRRIIPKDRVTLEIVCA